MARPKNKEALSAMTHAAWSLFVTQGYTATSYDDIAAASGTKRPLVQHYFPRKELLLFEGMKRLRVIAARQVDKTTPAATDAFDRFFLLGQIYIAALVSNESARAFLTDILDSRSLTQNVIAFDFDWSLAELMDEQEAARHREAFREKNIANMGGFYELLFYNLKNGRPFSVAVMMKPVMLDLMRELGIPEAEASARLNRTTLSDADLHSLGCATLDESLQKETFSFE